MQNTPTYMYLFTHLFNYLFEKNICVCLCVCMAVYVHMPWCMYRIYVTIACIRDLSIRKSYFSGLGGDLTF